MAAYSSNFSTFLQRAGSMALSATAQRQQQEATRDDQGERNDAQSRLLWLQQEQQQRKEQDLLKRQLATARASLAGSGAGFNGGSGAALLQGIVRSAGENLTDQYAELDARHKVMFPSQPRQSSAAGLMDKLQTGQQVFQVFRSAFGNDSGSR